MSTITKPIFLDETGQAMVSALQSLAAITSGYVGAPGAGFPSGGSSGQFLVKASSNDYDTNWSTISANDVGAEPAIVEVTVSSDGDISQSLDAGKIYHFTGALTSLEITLSTPSTGVLPHYIFDFDSGATAPVVSLPSAINMPSTFSVSSSKHYEIDILNGYGVCIVW